MKVKFLILTLGMLSLLTACESLISWNGSTRAESKFNEFLKENIDFSSCQPIGLPHRNYECVPTIKTPNLNISWGLDSRNTCNFLTVGKISGKVYGSPNRNDTFSCEMVIKISTPAVSGSFKQTIKFPNASNIFGSGYKIVAALGNYSYWGMPGEIHTYNISNPAVPVKINTTNTIADINEMKIYNNFLYVAGSRAGLYIHSLENPQMPKFVSVLPESSNIHDMVFVGNRAYLAADINGIIVLDITNPADPKILKKIPITGKVKGIDVNGNYAYIASDTEGFSIVDITSLENPSVVSHIPFTAASNKIKIKNNYAYMANSGDGVKIIDISNPLAPTLTRTLSGIGNIYNVGINGNFLYTIGITNGNRIYNLTDPSLPVLEKTLINQTAIAFSLHNNNLLLPMEMYGGAIYDLSDPNAPIATINSPHPSREIFIKDNLLISVAPSSLRVVDITSKQSPVTLTHMVTAGTASDVKVVDNAIYFTNGASLIIYDLTNPSALTTLSTTAAASSTAVFIKDNYAFVASGASGVRIFNITNKASPVLVSTITGVASAQDIFVKDNLAYICSSATTTPVKSAGLYIYDIGAPATPVFTGELATVDSCLNVKIENSNAFIALNAKGLLIADVSTPAQPSIKSALEGFVANHMTLSGHYAYVSSTWSGIRIINVQNPLIPVLEKTYYGVDHIYMSAVEDNYLYLANYRTGIHIIDLNSLP